MGIAKDGARIGMMDLNGGSPGSPWWPRLSQSRRRQ
jgi:hypothetical protein